MTITFSKMTAGRSFIYKDGKPVGYLCECRGIDNTLNGYSVDLYRQNIERRDYLVWVAEHGVGSARYALECAKRWAAKEAYWATEIDEAKKEKALDEEYEAHMESLNEGQWG